MWHTEVKGHSYSIYIGSTSEGYKECTFIMNKTSENIQKCNVSLLLGLDSKLRSIKWY